MTCNHTLAEQVDAILRTNGIDPDAETDNGQTARQRLEAAILGALDEIEEEVG